MNGASGNKTSVSKGREGTRPEVTHKGGWGRPVERWGSLGQQGLVSKWGRSRQIDSGHVQEARELTQVP